MPAAKSDVRCPRVLFCDWLSKDLRSEVLWTALRQGLDLAIGLAWAFAFLGAYMAWQTCDPRVGSNI